MMALADLQIPQGFFCAVSFPENSYKPLVIAGFRPAGPDHSGYSETAFEI
jgi:hypothetical protein